MPVNIGPLQLTELAVIGPWGAGFQRSGSIESQASLARRRVSPMRSLSCRQASLPAPPGMKSGRPDVPPEVRDQLKVLAIEKQTTVHKLVCQALNDLFAAEHRPEIAR